MSWRLVYYVMLGQGRRGEPRVFLSNSVGSLGIGVRRGKHFPREFPESARWDGEVGYGLSGLRRMTACLSSPENLKGIFWA
jgi:hypothetical protein